MIHAFSYWPFSYSLPSRGISEGIQELPLVHFFFILPPQEVYIMYLLLRSSPCMNVKCWLVGNWMTLLWDFPFEFLSKCRSDWFKMYLLSVYRIDHSSAWKKASTWQLILWACVPLDGSGNALIFVSPPKCPVQHLASNGHSTTVNWVSEC